jgi:hypothetical protein
MGSAIAKTIARMQRKIGPSPHIESLFDILRGGWPRKFRRMLNLGGCRINDRPRQPKLSMQ